MDYKRYLVTAALPYANGPVHIGHLAGCFLPADVYVRYLRAQKRDVKFVCGTDEHGVPITIRARNEGKSPQQIVDHYHTVIKDSLNGMDISFDIFSRTSKQIHKETSQQFFKTLYDKGVFEEKATEQYFDESTQTFLADRYIIGTCPVCSNSNAYGDQCEKCGSTLSPDMLIDPRSALSSATPIKKKTSHWYFPLNKYEDFLKEWIVEGKKDQWKSNVYGQCKSWIDGGLQPRAMTRDSDWGVPVPLENATGKVLYVWFDAPIGYISATKELTSQWSDYWQNEDTKLVHFMGKDNIVFHCIIFPSMLKAHGEYVLPENVPANEFLNIEGEKVSTSRNWAVWVDEYLKDFPGQQDALRYVLCANAPETKDNDFTWKDFQDRNNSELVAVFGNFINRTFVLMHKLCGGRVPAYHTAEQTDADVELNNQIKSTAEKVTDAIEHYRLREGLFEIIDLARKGNKYMQDCAPWLLAKQISQEDTSGNKAQQLIDNCLHICLQLTANLAILINPYLPATSRKMCHMMKVVERMLDWENVGKIDLLKTHYPLRAPELLFQKIEDDQVNAQLEKLHAKSKKPDTAEKSTGISDDDNVNIEPLKETIQFEDFAKIDLRTGIITEAVKVSKADKLLQLTVDMGNETRTIVSGIAMHFEVEHIIGKQVVVVANLAARKMRGIESNGMILMAENADGQLVFVNADQPTEGGRSVR